ncbi:MAG: hypothetical protein L6Q99_13135 [Planctomycetes bacterium]|nr:hypothetical protein [Planctomycetota bacterium]
MPAPTAIAQARFEPRRVIAEPVHVERSTIAGGVELVVRWRRPRVWLLVGFMVVWDAIVFVIGARLVETGASAWAWILSSVFFVAAVFLTYAAAAALANVTRIRATRESIRVAHGPLPWFGNLELAADAVTGFATRARLADREWVVRHGKRVPVESHDFVLHARLANGAEPPILRGAFDAETTCYLQQELERGLGLPHTPFPAESSL